MPGMNGFEQQLRTWRSALDAGAERVGWKIALGLVDDQEEPQLGHLTSATRIEDGGTYHRGGDRELRAEAELAVVVGAGYAAAIELVDVGRPPSDLESIVAANVFHRAFVLGPTRPAPPERIRMTVAGAVHEADRTGEDPEAMLAAAARHLAAAGERLEPGDVLITGSVIHVPAAPGDLVELEMGALGRLSVRIAP
jgi:2-oxo-3-hexenedioate decarboxylase